VLPSGVGSWPYIADWKVSADTNALAYSDSSFVTWSTGRMFHSPKKYFIYLTKRQVDAMA